MFAVFPNADVPTIISNFRSLSSCSPSDSIPSLNLQFLVRANNPKPIVLCYEPSSYRQFETLIQYSALRKPLMRSFEKTFLLTHSSPGNPYISSWIVWTVPFIRKLTFFYHYGARRSGQLDLPNFVSLQSWSRDVELPNYFLLWNQKLHKRNFS